MAEGLVLELQRMASDKSQDIEDLLRKALIVATKLNLADFRDWVKKELDSYGDLDDVPQYRRVRARLEVANPVQGRLMPFYLLPEMDGLLNIRLTQSIAELGSLARSDFEDLNAHMSPEEIRILLHVQGDFPMEPVKTISRIQIIGVVEAVRNVVLEWALKLEQEGILGDGMTFSAEEKKLAARSQQIRIGTFQGILGDVSQSEVCQQFETTIEAGKLPSLLDYLQANGVEDQDLAALKDALATDHEPTAPGNLGPEVSTWIGRMMVKAADGTWAIGIGAAGDLLARALAAFYGL